MKRALRGFTIIELLVVIATIGILTTIGLVTYTRIQADSRDSQRSSRVTVITEALEKYYQQNGEYPGCAAMTLDAQALSTNVLKGIDPAVFKTPTETSSTNSITCTDLTPGAGPDVFAYIGDSSSACTAGPACLEYNFKYREESTGSIKSITSRHTVSIATSGAIVDLTVDPGVTSVDLTWSSVSGAVSYNIDSATNSSFSTNKVSTTSDINSIRITGLVTGTTYYFRVLPVTSNGELGAWSNTVTATTVTLSPPTITAVVNSGTQITLSWPDVGYTVTGYTIQFASNVSFSPNTAYTQTGLSKVFTTGIAAGGTYSFRVRANTAADGSSGWSNYETKTTTPSTPTGVAATTNSATQITASWTAVPYATTYTLDYSTSSGFGTKTTITGITGLSRAITGLSQGTTYYFRVYALVGSTSSAVSSVANSTTTVNTPTGLAISNVGSSTMTVSWNSVPGATGYNLQNCNNSGCSPGGYLWSNTPSTSINVSGLQQGTTTYFRVQALVGGVSSAWSSTVGATTSIDAPTGVNSTTNSPTQVTVSWVAVTNATTYNVEYSKSSSFSSPLQVTGITGTSQAVTGLSQGTTYYFRVYALVGSNSSVASGYDNSTTTVNAPTGYSFSTGRQVVTGSAVNWLPGQSNVPSGSVWGVYGAVSGSCGAGSSPRYYHTASYNSPVKWYTAAWTTTTVWYIVATYSPWTVLYQAYIRCDGPNAVSSQVYLGQQCRDSNGNAC